MKKHFDVIVIGAGQAGLSISYLLNQKGIDHVVFEKKRLADSWRSYRWDTFCLVTPNWSVLGSARYDLTAGEFNQYRVGVGYIDDCIALALNYITDYSYGFSPTTNTSIQPGINHTVILQLSLRTLGRSR